VAEHDRPRETLLLPRVASAVFLRCHSGHYYNLRESPRGDPLHRAARRVETTMTATMAERSSVQAIVHGGERVIPPRGSLSASECDATAVSSDRSRERSRCIAVARSRVAVALSLVVGARSGHAIYKLSVSSRRAARVLHRA